MKAYLAFASVSFFWGTTYLAIRIGVEVLPPGLFAGVRFLIAGLILGGALLAKGEPLPAKREWKHQAVVGIALLVLANGVLVWAEQYVPSGMAALIVATLPFAMATIEGILPHGERLTLRKAVGMLVGFGGLILLLWPDLRGPADGQYLIGVVAIMFAPVFWAGGSIYSKYHKGGTPPLMAAAMQMLIAGVLLSIIGLLAGELDRFHFSTQGIGALLYLVTFGSIVGYGSYIYVLDKLPSAVVTMYAYINPVVAVFLGWLILSERLDLQMIIATAVILFGVVLVKTAPSGTLSPKQEDGEASAKADKRAGSAAAVCAKP